MEVSLEVDRSDLADTAQPDKLAAILIGQIKQQLDTLLPLPVEAVAKACGILDIQEMETDAFEGGLIQNEAKSHGYILLRAGRGPHRSRFTIAHELGHFVNLRHVAPPGSDRMLCNKDDLRNSELTSRGRHGMEAQANEFASCLLMPAKEVMTNSFMRGSAEMSRILELHTLCGVSKEAAARRYAQLHGDDFAVVFSKDGKYIYSIRGGEFPWIDLRKGQELFHKTHARVFDGTSGAISDQEESDAHWWLNDRDARRWNLWEEVLIQDSGFRMTLVLGEREDDE
ncbi:ImmA/IrrE family metallo-endopeptidase [Hydrogenophaga sp. YM1]|uniref:ImmA/IrrE family metallo-endopeptidase n=1 Tax=Hydrogenophaga sp. YM1 TaxID=2806262 RepID=UPI00195EF67A|nr:ImmA/IrrE family metallo-endopeptidase [Hydrogenophaga sp. YM1]QRR34696.1 ImmA/IrrE family metallo-endopeptidase [Hydrogenophaga sp. YM1]